MTDTQAIRERAERLKKAVFLGNDYSGAEVNFVCNDLLVALDREKVLEAEVESLKRYSNAHIDRAEAAEAQLATLRQQNDNLVNVLKALVEAPLRYNDKRIEIDCESHADAMARVSKARAAFPAPAQRDGE